jgi:hypothetical protein
MTLDRPCPDNRQRFRRSAVGICAEGAARIADDMRESALAPTTWSRKSTTVRAHCPRNTRMERMILVDILASRAREYPRNATSDSKVSANITKTKRVRRLAAVLLPLPSTVFHTDGSFLGNAMENSGKQNPETGFKSPPST